MTRYADTLLADGERVLLRSRQHWLAPIIDGRYPWALLLAGLVLMVLSSALGDSPARTVLGYAILVDLVFAIAWLGLVYWRWWAQDYLVTNRRVIKVEGVLNKHTADSSLEKINDAVLDQNVFGRMLNYGDLDIMTATDTAIDRYRMLDAAPRFKREMLNAKSALEQEYARPMMPSPPLRAAVASRERDTEPTPPPAPASPEPAYAAAAAGSNGPRPASMSADDVTRTLASLADLRDRGAITPEEFEAKKAELLARL
ncbi:MAG TPA: PH domain-containing protein [Candidatus Limnocylindrales bacterium]|nr:PH domain-containing protein [Candidatus Limnocylindrales bacterium]